MIFLKTLTQTCCACPSQWSGTTIDGKEVYVRYRWGHLRVDLNDVPVFSKDVGDDYDGSMDTDEMLEHTGMRFCYEKDMSFSDTDDVHSIRVKMLELMCEEMDEA